MAHPQQTYDKERISLNLARLKKGGDNFEIIIDNPKLALEFKEGMKVSPHEFLRSEEVFSDAKKGKLASEHEMEKVFGTSDPVAVAKIIIMEGEMQLTTEIRKEMYEAKRKMIIDYIHMNTLDPRTKTPHPPQRIELAMEQAKIKIDPYDSVKYQIKKILPELRTIIPLAVESSKLYILVPSRHAAKAYSVLKGKYDVSQEQWNNDGSVNFQVECKPGIKPEIIDIVNKLTNGEAEVKE